MPIESRNQGCCPPCHALTPAWHLMSEKNWKEKRMEGWNWSRWWFQVNSLFSLFPFRNLIHTQDRISLSLNIKGCALGDWQSHCYLRAASTQPLTGNLSNWKWSEWLGWILSIYFRKLHWRLFLCSVWWTGYWLERQTAFLDHRCCKFKEGIGGFVRGRVCRKGWGWIENRTN